jgi:hypothetical protein
MSKNGPITTDIFDQDDRIEQILGKDNINVSEASLQEYRSYLQSNIVLPCELTGREDFRWEEFYVFGPGDKTEYEELKKTMPSHTDTFTLVSFDEQIEDMDGLMVQVKRVSDNKLFVLPLVDLKAIDTDSPDSQLIDNYAIWYVNY